jgi:hypothetical protein
MGIVHHRGAVLRAAHVVVGQPQRVPHLVRGQLANAGQCHPLHLRRHLGPRRVRRQQPLGDQVVLPHAQASQRDVPLDDLARARVRHAGPVAPAARGAVHPLDHVVARVHGVDGVRHHLHAERVAVAGRLERLVPPARALHQRAADGLRRARVHVIDDGLHRIAHRRARVALFKPVAADEALRQLLADGRGHVVVVDAEIARPRVVAARLVSRRGQRDERVALAHGDRLGGGRHVAHPPAGVVTRKGERRLDLGVAWKRLGVLQIQRASRRVQLVVALPRALERCNYAVRVAQHEVGGIHQHPPIRFGLDLEPPQHRLREALLHRAPLRRVLRRRAVRLVGLHHQHPRPHPVESHQPLAAQLPAVQPDVVGSHPRGKRDHVDQLLSRARDLHPHPARGRFPVDGEKTVALLHRPRLFGDGRERGLRAERHGAQQGQAQRRQRGETRSGSHRKGAGPGSSGRCTGCQQ